MFFSLNHGFLNRGFVLLAATTLALAVQAQVPDPQIAGRIVRADNGTPIEGATITLVPPLITGTSNFPTTKTDNNGEYRFTGLSDGIFAIDASADGFVSQTYRRDASPEGVFQSISSSTRLRGVDFQLRSEAVIRGVVMNTAGQAVAGVPVAAVRKEVREDGTERLRPVSLAKTNSNGQFELKGLPEDSYFICVNGPNGYNAAPVAGVWYRETWYGNVHSVQGALPVPLRESEERSDIRINVESEKRYRVVVWPSGPEGEPEELRYDVTLEGRGHSSMKAPDGSYVIPDVPPGHYKLASIAWSGVQYVGEGDTIFEVSDHDVTLHLQLGGLGEIRGAVKWEDLSGRTSPEMIIGIVSQEGAAQGSHVDPDGSFTFVRVLPGRYQFRLLPKQAGAALRSVRCGGAEVTTESPLHVGDQQKVMDCEVTLKEPLIK